jgi:hypothetical protein
MPAKTMSISAKCSDCFGAVVMDEEGKEMFSYNGYVPGFFPDKHWGDYVMLDIELATGRILNWKAPTKAQLKAMEKSNVAE